VPAKHPQPASQPAACHPALAELITASELHKFVGRQEDDANEQRGRRGAQRNNEEEVGSSRHYTRSTQAAA